MNSKRTLVTILIVMITVVVLSVWMFRGHSVRNTPPQNDTIIAFGDSLVVGVGSTNENGFVTMLEDKLGKPIINSGVSGNTTRDGLERLEIDVIAKEPGVVLILLGGNDFLKRIPKDETFQNLRTIIDSIQEVGAVTVVLGVRGGLLSDNYEDSFEQLAEDTGSLYVPNVLDGLIGDSRYMYDAIHPNDIGYQLITDKILSEISSLF